MTITEVLYGQANGFSMDFSTSAKGNRATDNQTNDKRKSPTFGKAKLAGLGVVSLLVVALAISLTVVMRDLSGYSFPAPEGNVPDYTITSEKNIAQDRLRGADFSVDTEATSEKAMRLVGQQMRHDHAELDMMSITFFSPQGSPSESAGSVFVANSREAVEATYSRGMLKEIYTGEDKERIWKEQNGMVVVSFEQMDKELEPPPLPKMEQKEPPAPPQMPEMEMPEPDF